MSIIKAKYRGVHVDNYQGGGGKNYEDELLLIVPDNTKIVDIPMMVAKQPRFIKELGQNYKDENIIIYSIELMDFKTEEII